MCVPEQFPTGNMLKQTSLLFIKPLLNDRLLQEQQDHHERPGGRDQWTYERRQKSSSDSEDYGFAKLAGNDAIKCD